MTIDDFPKNAWDNGRPILSDFGKKATFYVSGGLCNQVHLGLRQYSLKTLDEVYQAGHEIGCHTFDHFNACQVPLRRFISSIDRNAEFLKQHLPDAEIRSFAYPYGDMTALTKISLAKRFSSFRGAMHGMNSNELQAGNLLCVCLQLNEMSRYDFDATMAEAAALKAWLIVLTHDISDNATPYGCHPRHLVKLLTLANHYGYDVLPVGDVMRRVKAG